MKIEAGIKTPSAPLAWLKRVLPAIVSLAILYGYFHDEDWGKLRDASLEANLWLAVLAIAIPQLVWWIMQTYLNQQHMEWFHGPFSFRKLFWVAGAIYILMFVNTALGGGGYLLYLQKKSGISWTKFWGILLFRAGLMLWGFAVVLIPGTLAMHYYGITEKWGWGLYVWWGLIIFGVLYLIDGWLHWHHNIWTGLAKLVVRDRNSEFWTAFRAATKKQWFLTWALALPPYFFAVLGFYFLALAFGIRIPFVLFMTMGPAMMLVMDLPIAFGGFGTATVAWMIFFGDYGDEDTIKSLTLFLPFARSSFRALIGIVSLRPALKEVRSLFAPEKSG